MTVLCITQARLGSTRLPAKVLKPVLGKPLLEYHLERLSDCRMIDKVVVATSEAESNKPLVDWLTSQNHAWYAGSETDVLGRFHATAIDQGLKPDDRIIRVTSDCPLVCPELIDNLVTWYDDNPCDYASIDISTYPRGVDAEIFTMAMLTEAYKAATTPWQREHVTPYFYQEPTHFRQGRLQNTTPSEGQYRLCVDEQADLELIAAIIEAHPANWRELQYSDIITFLDQNPEIAVHNREVRQKQV